MVPFEAVIIPLWQIMNDLGFTQHRLGADSPPQVALELRLWAYFGCVPISRICRVPLSRPALLSLIVLLFMWTWNDFLAGDDR